MKRSIPFILAASALFAVTAPAFAAHHKTPPWGKGPFKVLLEVNQNNHREWATTINNLRTMERVVGMSTAHAEVIAWGPGLKMVMKHSPYAKDIQSLSMYGIKFEACHQSMKAEHVTKADLAEGVGVVPGAIAEIIKRHNQGWTEIKE